MLNPNNKPPPTRPPEQALKIYRELGDKAMEGLGAMCDWISMWNWAFQREPIPKQLQFSLWTIIFCPEQWKYRSKLIGGLEHFLFFHILEKLYQLTNISKGLKPPTRTFWVSTVVRISGKVPCMGQTPPFQWATEPRMTSSTSGKTLGGQWGNPIKNHAHYNLPEILTESSSCGLPIVFHVYTWFCMCFFSSRT